MRFFDGPRAAAVISYLSAFSRAGGGRAGGPARALPPGDAGPSGPRCSARRARRGGGGRRRSEQAFKKFIHALQVIDGLPRLHHAPAHHGARPGLKAEHTMVDGLLVLRERTSACAPPRADRPQVPGSAHLRGTHHFDITDDGHRPLPPPGDARRRTSRPAPLTRREACLRHPGPGPDAGRWSARGLLRRCCSALPGSGKTLLGPPLPRGGRARRRARPLLRLLRLAPRMRAPGRRALAWTWSRSSTSGTLELSLPAAHGEQSRQAGRELLSLSASAASRLFLDGFDGLRRRPSTGAGCAQFMAALVNECRAHPSRSSHRRDGLALRPRAGFPSGGISMLTENILFLRTAEVRSELRRFISVPEAAQQRP